ncbi:MAG: universal stress protein [Desulfobulbia bacterium]
MSLKSLLVYLPNKDLAARLTEIAGNLALKSDGHLIGFHAMPAIQVYGAMTAEIPIEVIERQERVFRHESEQIAIEFEKIRNALGIQAEFRSEEFGNGDSAKSVAAQARCSDLIVVDQGAESNYIDGHGLPARLVLESGRPVLIIPSYGEYKEIGKHVLIAWNDSRESARACFDALPILRNAEKVTILTINQVSDAEQQSFSPADDLALCLSRHNLNIETHNIASTPLSVSNEILSRAADFGSDLLVMGCYGHSRFHETVFGGVTREILNSLSLPVLMSH